jgi:hypothetical protein
MAQRDVLEQEFQQTLERIKTSHQQFAFDREGRPGAIAAIRGALPLMERELFDAVIEDCECEFAAMREAALHMLARSVPE